MDSQRRSRLAQYRRARRKFACCVYLLTVVWMVIALVQWFLLFHFAGPRDFFRDKYYVSIVFFCVALLLVTLFIFYEPVRFIIVVNWLLTIIIVEGITLGVAALVVRSNKLTDILMYFGIVALLIFVFIILGSILPHDLTLDVVILFVLAFVFLIVTVFFLMFYIVSDKTFSFIVYAVFISIIVLLFVMYHAQTINGGRFAEMRLNDYLLATLILFHDFVIIYMLTFCTIRLNPKNLLYFDNETTTTTTTTTTAPE